jgi:molybdopterin converting factor subunit 1
VLNILVFAGLAEAVGGAEAEIAAEAPITVADLKRRFADTYPGTESVLATCFAAVNQTFADDDTVIEEGDEVAFLPPVSGG